MPMFKKSKNKKQTVDKGEGSESEMDTSSDHKVKIMKSTSGPVKQPNQSSRQSRHMERVGMLARPTSRRLRSLWDEKCAILPADRRDKIKSALEEDYFLSPEQTEQYFQSISHTRQWTGVGTAVSRKEHAEMERELRQREKWLINFSAQVAYRICDYIAKGEKEMLVSNRLRSIADVVLERVADILGEPKPSRSHPGRLARFMVAISDRIAVWIENAVYRANALEWRESGNLDDHVRLDAEQPLVR
ncbi:uncharacterized protein [Battus philenor]|uniref:uncharacterized protein n=1 Tax=Battus philenor TaxID=42288 RepID=UPI0035D10EDD